MNKISIIKIEFNSEQIHQNFEWNSEQYKKLIAVFCSPDVQLALVFNDGREVFIRNFNFQKTKSVPPNSRVMFINKELENEVITGVLSIQNLESEDKAVYLILEK